MSVTARSGLQRFLQLAFYVAWAAVLGISVPLGVVNTVFLNSEAAEDDRRYHAVYVANLAVAMGGVELLPWAIRSEKPMTQPKRWWHLAGGLGSIPVFFAIAATSMLGSQVVLVVQLAALLTTFFIFDLVDGRVRLNDVTKFPALLIIFSGVVLENVDQGAAVSGSSSIEAIAMLALVAVSGMGFAVQSKCNSALAEDLGSAFRASVVSSIVHVVVSVPVELYIFFGCHVPVSLSVNRWVCWLAAGLQSAFYITSMAYLPKVLGFTKCYVISSVAKMVTSLIIDAKGLTGQAIPISMTRVCALVIVLLGSVVFNAAIKPEDKTRTYGSLEQASASKEECI
mmetsp:Transcript_29385/g.51490  ORF Transcript_29385/g.51490 Transcript_29385/m.51490 type:complete len:340 (+) Transcript_29385:79-1098(+)